MNAHDGKHRLRPLALLAIVALAGIGLLGVIGSALT